MQYNNKINMFKVIESEVLRNYYMVHRLMLLFTRTRGIPKTEATGISVAGNNHDQRRFLINDVEAYQEGADVRISNTSLIRNADLELRELEKE